MYCENLNKTLLLSVVSVRIDNKVESSNFPLLNNLLSILIGLFVSSTTTRFPVMPCVELCILLNLNVTCPDMIKMICQRPENIQRLSRFDCLTLFELIGYLKRNGMSETTLLSGYREICLNSRVGFDSKIFDDFRTVQHCEADDALEKTRDGIFKCPKCNLKKTSFEAKQTRSLDEPMTIFIYCLNCLHRWTQ